jgi:hypothetical protein
MDEGVLVIIDDPVSQPRERSPLRRLPTIEDVDSAAALLSGDIARNITGGVL